MVSRFESSMASSSYDASSVFDIHDHALERTAILARHLFPLADFKVDSLQPVPVVGGPAPQQNRQNNPKPQPRSTAAPTKSSAPNRAQPNKAPPAPAKAQPRPNPVPQKVAPPPQRTVAPPSPPRPAPQPALATKHAQLVQQMEQVRANIAASSKLLSSAAASMPQPSPQIPPRGVPTLPPVSTAPSLPKIPQQNFSNLAASAPRLNPSTPVPSFTQPPSTHPAVNSHSQPIQIPTSQASAAPKQIASPPQVPPSSAPKASPIPNNPASKEFEPPKPFLPRGHQPSSDPAAIAKSHMEPIIPTDVNPKVNTPTTLASPFTQTEGGLPPTAAQIQTLTPPPPYSPSSITGVDLKSEYEKKFLARSNPAPAPIKTPVVANIPPVPTSLVPTISPIVQKALETNILNNEASLARTSNIVNQLKEVPATPATPSANVPAKQPERVVMVDHDAPVRMYSKEIPSVPSSPVRAPVKPMKEDSAIDFTVGFFKGLKNGAKESATDFIPGLVNAAKNIGNFTAETIKRPIEHTKEVYAAIEETVVYLKTHDLGEIGQKLAPEVHKLVTQWDTLPSAEKGELTGYCIGKYGTDLALTAGALKGVKIAGAALRTETAVGAAVKEAVAVSNAGKAIAGGVETRALAQEVKAVPRVGAAVERSAVVEARAGSACTAVAEEVKIASQPVQVAEKAQKLVTTSEGWVLPPRGGAQINGRWYSEHALERMAPRTPRVMADLETRALERAKALGLQPGTEEFGKWWKKNGPDPRGIPPSLVEAEIANPGSTNIRVILNEQGSVKTVMHGD